MFRRATTLGEPSGQAWRQLRIDQEVHWLVDKDNAVLACGRAERQGRAHVLLAQIGIVGKDFRLRHAIGQQIQYVGYANPGTPDMRSAPADSDIDMDTIPDFGRDDVCVARENLLENAYPRFLARTRVSVGSQEPSQGAV